MVSNKRNDLDLNMEAARESMQAAQPQDRPTRLRYNYEELVGQPAAIEKTLAVERNRIHSVAEQLSHRLSRRIYGIGCGDSWFATQAVRATFEQLLELPFEPLQALEFTRYASSLVGRGDVVIGLSASGTTAETLRGLEVARAAGAFTVGITMREESPFAKVPESYLLAHAMRRASFPTQASTTSMAVLLALAAETARLRDRHPEHVDQLKTWLLGLPSLVAQIISDSEPAAAALAPRWIHRDVFTFVGAGPGRSAAMFGAAKIREECEAIGWIIGVEEFHHYEIIQAGDPIFLVAPDDPAYFRAVDVAKAVQREGGVLYSIVSMEDVEIAGRSVVAFRIPSVPPTLVALPYTLPLQMIAWHIASAKLQAGRLL